MKVITEKEWQAALLDCTRKIEQRREETSKTMLPLELKTFQHAVQHGWNSQELFACYEQITGRKRTMHSIRKWLTTYRRKQKDSKKK